jgi:hypothetical protein
MTLAFSRSGPKHPMVYWICYAAILLVAVLSRFLPIRSSLPYSDYVDEGHVLHQTIDAFNRKSLDVYWYGLPALPAYSAGAALFLYGPIYRHFHGHRFQKDLPNDRTVPSSKFNYDLITPVELIVAGRFVTACLSVASVVLAGVIARRLLKYRDGSLARGRRDAYRPHSQDGCAPNLSNGRAGLLAMLLMAVCPALVTRGSIVIVDTFAAFFVLVTVYLCLRVRAAREPEAMARATCLREATAWQAGPWLQRNSLLAGMSTGLVFASKYPVASVGVVVMTVIVALPISWWRRFQLMLVAGCGVLLGILVGAPMTFFKPAVVWHDVIENIRAYSAIHSPQGYFAQAISMSELGVPLLLVGLAGIILMVRQRGTRVIAVSWILFALALTVLFANSSFRPFRSFLSLVPLLCIAAAIFFSALIEWSRSWWRLGIAIVLIGGCVASLGFSSFQQVERRMAHRDSRIQAVDWLQEHAKKEAAILVLRELAILPAELGRIGARITVVSWSEALTALESQRFDYVVTGEIDLQHATDRAALSEYRDRWNAKVADIAVQAEFGEVGMPVVPYVWRTNDERIVIVK